MFHKRQYPQIVSKQMHQLQLLKSHLTRQLRITIISLEKSCRSHSLGGVTFPNISQSRPKPSFVTPTNEKMKCQNNLDTMPNRIKNNMQSTNRAPFGFSPAKPRLRQSHIGEFRVTAINMSSDFAYSFRSKNDLSRSYVNETEKRLAKEKRKKILGFERFDFQPWTANEDGSFSQTLPI